MKSWKIKIVAIVLLFTAIGLANCRQESMFFHPTKLKADYKYDFNHPFEERFITVDENVKLNALHFRTNESKRLVYYLHGNAGALNSWGKMADFYLENNYDIFILDYRSFGKSEGKIRSEEQFLNDVQIVYDTLITEYKEENIIVVGYSIGTCLAASIAANNNPKHLILKAPYNNMVDLVHHYYSIVPSWAIKYHLPTDQYLEKTKCPITIFHGTKDKVIPVEATIKLQSVLKEKTDTAIIVEGKNHYGVGDWPEYKNEVKAILNE